MAKNPSTRWYFNDWMNEPGLRLCSAAARGLWMDMLCLAAAATRKGYVEIEGKACTAAGLAKLANSPRSNVRRWLIELEEHGVFSRDEDGAIFNRRMVRENGEGGHKTASTPPKRTVREQDPNQAELFEKSPPTHARAPAPYPDSGSFASSKDSTPTDKPETLNAAREQEGKEGQVKVEGNPEEARCARLGSAACQGGSDPPINETPVGVGPAGATYGGTDDADTSLPSPVADPNRLGSRDQARTDPLAGSASSPSTRFGALRGGDPTVQPEPDTPKTRMPARLADRHRDGECDAVPSQAPASDYHRVAAGMQMPAVVGPALCKGASDALPSQTPATDHGELAPSRQAHPAPLVGEGQPAMVGPSPAESAAASRPSLGAVAMLGPGPCPRTGKSPALKAKIRDQLVSKCARFLDARRPPEELAAYWAAMLDDDPAVAQSMLDAVDRQMRCAGWDDMRTWKAQHGIAA